MKKFWGRKLLVGLIVFTTAFSSIGTAVATAADGEEAVYSVSTESLEASQEASIFEPLTESMIASLNQNAETVSLDETEVGGDSGEQGTDTEIGAGTETNASSAATGSTIEEADAQSGTSEAVEKGQKADTEDAAEETSKESSEAASEASSDELTELDLSDQENLDNLTDEEKAELLGTMLAQTPAPETTPDLSDSSFAKVTNHLPGTITDISKEFSIGFDFEIFKPELIPDGKFVYTLPASLDFSKAAGSEIPVYEDGRNIGTAVVGSDNVMRFSIAPENVVNKPNGLKGSVSLSCKFDAETIEDKTPIKVVFSNGDEIEVNIENPVITAYKKPVAIKNGTAWFSVKFTVSSDVKDFVITDELGDNLEFTGRWNLNNESTVLAHIQFEKQSPHKLVVHAGDVPAGKYTLYYQVRAIDDYNTSGKTAEQIIAEHKNSNKASWSWQGSNTHSVDSYATQSESKWLSKFGTNRSNPGGVTPDGIAQWQIYINGGSVPHNLSGYTFVDEVDDRMEYIKESFEVKISYDQMTWADCPELRNLIVFDGNKFTIKFTKDIPVAYYRIFYNTKIKGDKKDYPTKEKTKYNNKASIYRGDEFIAGAEASNDYFGVFFASIYKDMLGERSDAGLVNWETVFTTEGRDSNNVVITDTISPEVALIGGKTVGAYMIEDSIKLYRLGSDSTTKTEVTGFKVTFSEDGSSYTLTADKLPAGMYVIYYSTQDYYGNKDGHSFPSGSTIRFTNNASLKIDKTVMDAEPKAYEFSTDGLPMDKTAMPGSYDTASGNYLIPWNIKVNKNDLGQSTTLVSGSKATVTDKLPEGLEYVEGSALITKADAADGISLEPTVTREDNRETLTWNFDWEAEYYTVSFKTKVADTYIKSLIKKGGSGKITLSFDNEAFGQVGNASGMANGGSQDTITLLEKKANLNEETGHVEYSVVVNELGTDIFSDREEIKLTDKLEGGVYEAGTLKIYNYDPSKEDKIGAEYQLDISKIEVSDDSRSFAITIPDNKAFVVKYTVIPDSKDAVDVGDGKKQVTVGNTATLIGEGTISTGVKESYIIENAQADITSDKGVIKITKVSTGNSLVGLQGAVFRLVRIDVSNGKEEVVATAASDSNGVVKFEKDGKYDSLIFDNLYYYQETSAPNGYKLDDTKHYIVFKGEKYSENADSIKAYLSANGISGLVEYDINTSETGSTYGAVVENDLIPDVPDDPTPEPPTGNTVVTETITTTIPSTDIPQVLGARRTPGNGNIPAVLGARRSATGDRSMAGSVVVIIVAVICLGLILTKRNKVGKL
ncbi:SpaA isopeptide-forming pilin-related protein [Butyrivibrio sp. INlla14]|uniref:SpaA isopeptide-forming pilin-related protein n=1 Tax=Butyrivibrio sp. INlla14 TaxID=1520808 RepID=UPI000876ADCF|nr:SpaA isopeptide-forming pilin-related protein [Butyrivibrio sp. INlla14]SCY54181.1 hypothetical protein SAMN02910371_02696 [Butyrivibrio sp. INlla14]